MTAQNKRTSERRPADPIPIISERPVQLTARTTTPALADPEPLLRAIESSGNLAFTMSFKQGFPARILAGKNPIGSAGDTIIMGDVVHPDDYQPFCEVIAQVTAGTADEIKLHARLNNGGDYQWFYITGKVHRSGSPLEFIEGMMFNVTDYLDCEGEDIVMRRYRSKHSVKINDQSTYTLRDILGEDYLVRIQQPLSQASGLFSAITDNDGAVILPKGQDRKINLNKMDYQRKKSIRVRHQTVGTWLITGEDRSERKREAERPEVLRGVLRGSRLCSEGKRRRSGESEPSRSAAPPLQKEKALNYPPRRWRKLCGAAFYSGFRNFRKKSKKFYKNA